MIQLDFVLTPHSYSSSYRYWSHSGNSTLFLKHLSSRVSSCSGRPTALSCVSDQMIYFLCACRFGRPVQNNRVELKPVSLPHTHAHTHTCTRTHTRTCTLTRSHIHTHTYLHRLVWNLVTVSTELCTMFFSVMVSLRSGVY